MLWEPPGPGDSTAQRQENSPGAVQLGVGENDRGKTQQQKQATFRGKSNSKRGVKSHQDEEEKKKERETMESKGTQSECVAIDMHNASIWHTSSNMDSK